MSHTAKKITLNSPLVFPFILNFYYVWRLFIQAIVSPRLNHFICMLLLSEGRAGKIWEPSNKMMLFLIHPPPEISFFFFANVFPFVQSSTASYVRRLSHTSKMADWKTKDVLFVKKKEMSILD